MGCFLFSRIGKVFSVHLLFFTCGLQTFESRFERRLILEFSEVMFVMKQFEQVSNSSFEFVLL